MSTLITKEQKSRTKSEVPCVILAGGLATRLKSLSEKTPKSLLPVADQPFLYHQLKHLQKTGVTRVILCIGHFGKLIQDYAGDGSRFGLEIEYAFEGEDLLGTGGALRNALDQNKLPEAFLLTNGDSYLPVDFSEIWEKANRPETVAAMTVFKNDNQWDHSNCIFKNGKVFYDKSIQASAEKPKDMVYIDYGLLYLRSKTIRDLVPPQKKYDLSSVLHELSVKDLLSGIEVFERFYEIGSVSGLETLNKWLKGNNE